MVDKQQICPALVNTSLQKLTKINPLCSNITIVNEWEDSSEQSDPVLWKLLTDKNASDSNNSGQTDSDDDIEGNDKFEERELKDSSSPFPTVMYNVDGPNISPFEIVKGNPNSQGILNWIIQILHYYYSKQHKNIENSQIIEQNLVIFSLCPSLCLLRLALPSPSWQQFFSSLNVTSDHS